MTTQYSNTTATAGPHDEEPISDVGEMSQWQLTWLRFRRHRLAMIGTIGLVILYTMVALAGFLAPNPHTVHNEDYMYGPPSPITFVGPEGKVGLRPYTPKMVTHLDQEKFQYVFVKSDELLPVRFFVRGSSYKLLGLFESDLHLLGVDAPARLYLLGADAFGRDVFARLLVGGQVSMTVGWVGVMLTIFLGSLIGAASGYWGGMIDEIMQRIIEVVRSFPTVPLWAALAALLPPISESFTGIHRYFLITVILSLVNWTGLARQLRGKIMAYHQMDFVQAALAAGASDVHVIFTHMLPNAASHIIVVAALAVPGMILGETSLSFLGLGILPPLVSWGSLLKDAQQLSVVVEHPWLMTPGIGVIVAVLLFSFLGDGLRDAVDPYAI